MSLLSVALAALRVYAAGAAVILAQLLRRCCGGFPEPGQPVAGVRRGEQCGVFKRGSWAPGPGALGSPRNSRGGVGGPAPGGGAGWARAAPQGAGVAGAGGPAELRVCLLPYGSRPSPAP